VTDTNRRGTRERARLWGGGFSEPLDPTIERFTESFSFDRRLLRVDVAANLAWVMVLRDAGIVSALEAERLEAALQDIAETPIPASNGAEDIHTYVESEVALRLDAGLAGRLRTGRSRNDLVATDLRLYCRQEIAAIRRALVRGVRELSTLAGQSGLLIVPGYTHLRRAQPILLAHQMLSHAERLMRDDARFAEALARLDACPLGSAALAGTTLRVDRQALAARLGFARPTPNSLDGVGDRDFVADALYACALTMVHLSQMAEDLILATAEEFGWLSLSDAAATGSCLMPQKRNPDVLELLRGKAGRVAGRLSGFLTTLKGLPSAYNRDLQEDKEALFDALDTTLASLEALAATLPRLAPVPDRGLGSGGDDLLATDLADYLVAHEVPFAQAHRLAGEAAARARATGQRLSELTIEALREVSPQFGPDVFRWLDPRAAVSRRSSEGGTAPERVTASLARVAEWVAVRLAAGEPAARGLRPDG
jgi:argininosuccinate lyase